MTLAIAILLLGVFPTATPADSRAVQDSSSTQSQSTTAAPATNKQENSSSQSQTKSSPTPAQPTTSQSAPKSTTHTRKKKPKATNCDTGAAGSTSNPTAGTAVGPSSNPSGATTAGGPAQNCPPEKVVVPKGGTADPSIKLAGGNQASQNREDSNKLLVSTEENLKKVSGQQLTASQQETVSQIRQFVDQSKTALAAGDVERAHTLAWKAQVLSEDLANPK